MTEATGWKRKADWVCRGVKCRREDGSRPTYELPVGSTRCPVCGSKRIEQLFNKVSVIGTRPAALVPPPDMRATSSSHLARSNALLQDGFDHWNKIKSGANGLQSYDAVNQPVPGVNKEVMRHALGGIPGTGHEMQHAEIASHNEAEDRQMRRLIRAGRAPSRLANVPAPLAVQRKMAQQAAGATLAAIPTRAHYNKGEAPG